MSTIEMQNSSSGLNPRDFQETIEGKATDLFVLRNTKGMEVALTNYGCALLAIMVPDRKGKCANVILGHDSIGHVKNSPEPFLNTVIGRYANRIARGHFLLHGKEYRLDVNNVPNTLHGGNGGFHGFRGMRDPSGSIRRRGSGISAVHGRTPSTLRRHPLFSGSPLMRRNRLSWIAAIRSRIRAL